MLPPNSVLSPEVETLPEVFQRSGFRTAGFTEGGYVSGRFGFRRGFDVFVSRNRDHNRPVERTFGRGIDFLKSVGPKDRFFLFLHTYAVHTPYDAPEQYRKPFWPGPPPAGAINGTGPGAHPVQHDRRRAAATRGRVAQALYDAGIRQTDDVLGRFFAELERLGLAGEVTVVDHRRSRRGVSRSRPVQSHAALPREPARPAAGDPSRPSRRRAPWRRRAAHRPGAHALRAGAGTAAPRPERRQPGRARRAPVGAAPRHRLERDPGRTAGGLPRRAAEKESLLLFDPPAGELAARARWPSIPPAGRWRSRPAPTEARHLVVRQGEERIDRVPLTSDWTPVRVAPANPGRLFLEADGCTDSDRRKEKELECHSFQIRGLRLTRIELYDVAKDPGQIQDLSRETGADDAGAAAGSDGVPSAAGGRGLDGAADRSRAREEPAGAGGI